VSVQDYEAFYQAVDDEKVHEFLGLIRPGSTPQTDAPSETPTETPASSQTEPDPSTDTDVASPDVVVDTEVE
jgi:hypothetical protein